MQHLRQNWGTLSAHPRTPEWTRAWPYVQTLADKKGNNTHGVLVRSVSINTVLLISHRAFKRWAAILCDTLWEALRWQQVSPTILISNCYLCGQWPVAGWTEIVTFYITRAEESQNLFCNNSDGVCCCSQCWVQAVASYFSFQYRPTTFGLGMRSVTTSHRQYVLRRGESSKGVNKISQNTIVGHQRRLS